MKTPLIVSDEIEGGIAEELAVANTKHPDWPSDIARGVVIVSEAAGKVALAYNRMIGRGGRPGSKSEVKAAAYGTIAVAIRLIQSLE